MINKESRTYNNLMAAFQGESMARTRYAFAMCQARKEGEDEIADLFETMVDNETAHSKLLYQLARGINTTKENLLEAISEEMNEWSNLYPHFAQIAREEGYETIAGVFEQIAQIERDHERRFRDALVKYRTVHKLADHGIESPKNHEELVEGYRCKNCGAIFVHREDICPVCGEQDTMENTLYYKFD